MNENLNVKADEKLNEAADENLNKAADEKLNETADAAADGGKLPDPVLTGRVETLLKDLSGKEEITAEELLTADLALDSLAMVTLLVELEDQFCITLDEADMNPFDLHTVADVIRLVEKYSEGQNDTKN